MSRLHRVIACVLTLALLALGLSAGALAAGGGTTTSAGDNQYVDPLTSTTHKTSPATTPTTPSQTATAPSTSSTVRATTTSATASTTATASDAPTKTLPFTGLNVGGILAAGLGLLAAGLALRRLAARA